MTPRSDRRTKYAMVNTEAHGSAQPVAVSPCAWNVRPYPNISARGFSCACALGLKPASEADPDRTVKNEVLCTCWSTAQRTAIYISRALCGADPVPVRKGIRLCALPPGWGAARPGSPRPLLGDPRPTSRPAGARGRRTNRCSPTCAGAKPGRAPYMRTTRAEMALGGPSAPGGIHPVTPRLSGGPHGPILGAGYGHGGAGHGQARRGLAWHG